MPMAVNLLRSRGLRERRPPARPRGAVRRRPPGQADEVAQASQAAFESDLASVYRNLDTLEEVGLVRHVHFGHAPGLYALSGADQHGYAACERCGRHAPLAARRPRSLRAPIREITGFACDFTHFPLSGACPDCAGER